MDTREEIAGPALQPGPSRESSSGALGDGAGWGALVGAALGIGTALMFVAPLGTPGQEYGFSFDAAPSLLVILAFAGFVGACYGAVTGFIAGFGAILAPTPGTTQRLVVCGLALAVVVATVTAFSAAWGTLALAPEMLVVLLLAVALTSWLVAPRINGRRTPSTSLR